MSLLPMHGAVDVAVADSGDLNILVLSDSRSNGVDEWPYLFATWLGTTYPAYTIEYEAWNGAAWDASVTVDTGSGANTIKFWNGSADSYEWADHITNRVAVIQHPSAVSHIILCDTWNANLASLIDILQTDWPAAITTMMQSSPIDGTDITADQAAIASTCLSYGLPVVETVPAFVAYGDWATDLYVDTTHPNATGQQYWLDNVVIGMWLKGEAPVANVIDSAELVLQASDYGGSGLWLDGSGNGHNATNSGALFQSYDGDQYVHFPGTAGVFVNSNVPSPNGAYQFDVRFEIRRSELAASMNLAKDGNGTFVVSMVADDLRLQTYDTTTRVTTSTAGVPYSAGDWFQIRVVFDGTSNPMTYDYYTRDPGTDLAVNTGWNALGTQQTIAAAFGGESAFANSWIIGSSTAQFVGDMTQVLCMFGAGNTIFCNVDFRNTDQLAEPFTNMVADDTLTWTLTRGDVGLYVVDRQSFGLHTDDYFEIPDDANLDFAAAEAFTVMACMRSSSIAAGDTILVAKKDNLTTSAGWALYRSTAAGKVLIGDGSADDDDTASSLVARTVAVVAGVRNIGDDDIEAFLDGTGSGTPTTDSTTATLVNALPLRVGATSNTAASFFDGEIMAVALWRSALSDADVATAGDELAAIAVAVSGTAVAGGVLESEIVTGGDTIVLTLTNDTWVATVGADNAITTALIAGIDSAQSEAAGWDAEVKGNMVFGDVARTSDTVVTITLAAEAAYAITADETITVTIPATALTLGAGAGGIVAAPTFVVTNETPASTGTLRNLAGPGQLLQTGG